MLLLLSEFLAYLDIFRPRIPGTGWRKLTTNYVTLLTLDHDAVPSES